MTCEVASVDQPPERRYLARTEKSCIIKIGSPSGGWLAVSSAADHVPTPIRRFNYGKQKGFYATGCAVNKETISTNCLSHDPWAISLHARVKRCSCINKNDRDIPRGPPRLRNRTLDVRLFLTRIGRRGLLNVHALKTH